MVGVAMVGWGCLDPSPAPAPAPHLYITNHFTSFKTMCNIVYELASFKAIICRGRGGRG